VHSSLGLRKWYGEARKRENDGQARVQRGNAQEDKDRGNQKGDLGFLRKKCGSVL